MRKSLCFFFITLFLVSGVNAQGVAGLQEESDTYGEKRMYAESVSETENLRKKYFHLSYSSTKMSNDNDLSGIQYKSKYGVSMTFGKSYFLHKKPIAGMLYIGIDATWIDLTYSYYRYNLGNYFGEFGFDDKESYEISDYQGEIAMQVGPSFHLYPIGKMQIEAYFRYAPTFSLLVEDGSFAGNYATYFVSGGAISYHCIGLGAEARFGNCKYKAFGEDDGETFYSKTKFRGYRVFLSFRF